ncbi:MULTISPECIES: (2Fe-2S)-binding protein [unclassified Rhizobium]|uniref:(2Fe-2S)-binding protein n=1 Tax=unclassified Rhizobium TaxID=2613769 RepID=UPI0007615768|nr:MULTISPECIES: (2Fe-2S)-binding protein [unclassified Rhizobium]
MIAWRSLAPNRLPAGNGASAQFTVDGYAVSARTGETVLTALRMMRSGVHNFELNAAPREGFCLMGACQDCWLWRSNGERLRACTALVEPGMQLSTIPGTAR